MSKASQRKRSMYQQGVQDATNNYRYDQRFGYPYVAEYRKGFLDGRAKIKNTSLTVCHKATFSDKVKSFFHKILFTDIIAKRRG